MSYNSLLKDTVSYEKYSGVNQYNEKTYSTATDKKCFKNYRTNVVTNYENEQVISGLEIFLDFKPSRYDRFDGSQLQRIDEVKKLHSHKIVGYRVYV